MDWKPQRNEDVSFPHINHRAHEIPIEIQAKVFENTDKLFLKVTWKDKVPSISENNLEIEE